jgi:hypothetical protein
MNVVVQLRVTVMTRLLLVVPLVISGCATQPVSTSSQPASPILGAWTRMQDCETMLAAFRQAGIADARSDWVAGVWGTDGTNDPSNPCAGAAAARPHTIFFDDGGFGSYDPSGDRSIETEFRVVDADTIALEPRPGGSYSHELVVDYAINGDSATFSIVMPADCPSDTDCSTAYAWALSHLYGEGWRRES